MRLDRIVESGLKVDATHAHDFIREGKVSVHAQEAQRVVTHPRFQVILGLEEVHVSGKPIALPFNKTLIMNKPKQCISERVRGTESWCRSRGISFGSEEHSLSLEKGNPKVRKEIGTMDSNPLPNIYYNNIQLLLLFTVDYPLTHPQALTATAKAMSITEISVCILQ
eukprot:m.118642 g.118642  ORF g.118642 m.118642 type:complete len:167 (+) comp9345_c0_seq7:1523-2023(+)